MSVRFFRNGEFESAETIQRNDGKLVIAYRGELVGNYEVRERLTDKGKPANLDAGNAVDSSGVRDEIAKQDAEDDAAAQLAVATTDAARVTDDDAADRTATNPTPPTVIAMVSAKGKMPSYSPEFLKLLEKGDMDAVRARCDLVLPVADVAKFLLNYPDATLASDASDVTRVIVTLPGNVEFTQAHGVVYAAVYRAPASVVVYDGSFQRKVLNTDGKKQELIVTDDSTVIVDRVVIALSSLGLAGQSLNSKWTLVEDVEQNDKLYAGGRITGPLSAFLDKGVPITREVAPVVIPDEPGDDFEWDQHARELHMVPCSFLIDVEEQRVRATRSLGFLVPSMTEKKTLYRDVNPFFSVLSRLSFSSDSASLFRLRSSEGVAPESALFDDFGLVFQDDRGFIDREDSAYYDLPNGIIDVSDESREAKMLRYAIYIVEVLTSFKRKDVTSVAIEKMVDVDVAADELQSFCDRYASNTGEADFPVRALAGSYSLTISQLRTLILSVVDAIVDGADDAIVQALQKFWQNLTGVDCYAPGAQFIFKPAVFRKCNAGLMDELGYGRVSRIPIHSSTSYDFSRFFTSDIIRDSYVVDVQNFVNHLASAMDN